MFLQTCFLVFSTLAKQSIHARNLANLGHPLLHLSYINPSPDPTLPISISQESNALVHHNPTTVGQATVTYLYHAVVTPTDLLMSSHFLSALLLMDNPHVSGGVVTSCPGISSLESAQLLIVSLFGLPHIPDIYKGDQDRCATCSKATQKETEPQQPSAMIDRKRL